MHKHWWAKTLPWSPG